MSQDQEADVQLETKTTETEQPKLVEGNESAPVEVAATETPVESVYEPNYKFKAYDKEYDFPDWAKELVKSKDLEEKFRSEFAKAYAHDELREKYTKLQPYREKYESIEQNINKLEKYLNAGDVEGFFVNLGYKPDQVEKMLSQYVLDKINYREMPEEDRRRLDESRLAKQQAQDYEERFGKVQSELEEYKIKQLDTELRITLNEPTVADLATQWDQRTGIPGSFREEVILRADRASKQLGRTVTPQEAVNDFSAYARGILGTAQPMQTQQPMVPSRQKPMLPNANNKTSASPAKQRFKSLEDLEKYVGDRWGN